MSLPRFHLIPSDWESACLTGDEARHCSQVVRRKPGDRVIVFDGAGGEATAEIASIRGGRVELRMLEKRRTPAPAVSVALIQAIPKGVAMEWIIEKAVELGVNEVFPVITERTVVRLEGQETARKREKWQRVALEACKQCGQNWLPRVHAPAPFLETLGAPSAHELKIIAAIEPDALSLKEILPSAMCRPRSVIVAVGPEGDFTPAEYAAARGHGFRPMTLGPLVLRAETAALYALSVLVHELR